MFLVGSLKHGVDEYSLAITAKSDEDDNPLEARCN